MTDWRSAIKKGRVDVYTHPTLWWWHATAKRVGSIRSSEGEGRGKSPTLAADRARAKLDRLEEEAIAQHELNDALSDPKE